MHSPFLPRKPDSVAPQSAAQINDKLSEPQLFKRLLDCLLLAGCVFMVSSSASAASTSTCGADKSQHPYLKITTPEGPIDIELFEAAAPASIARITELAGGPTGGGYYDGMSFNLTLKRLHITSSGQGAGDKLEWPLEIDAEALGLDQDKISSPGEAMDTWQMRLLKFYYRGDKQRDMPGKFPQWQEQWQKTRSADFLIGVSEKEINEAMGVVYTRGLDSRPVLKGSVVLKPATASSVTPRLRIVLQDMPLQTGRWMVIGQVVDGLTLAEDLSLRPLTTPSHIKPRDFTPAKPVLIESVRVDCRSRGE